ncbi:MAG: sugar transferase [Gaiellales bacterium]
MARREASRGATRAQPALIRRYAPSLGERRLVLFLADQLALLFAFVLSGQSAVRGAELLDVATVLGLAIVWWAAASAVDAYEIRRAAHPMRSVVSAWSAFAVALVVMILAEAIGLVAPGGIAPVVSFAFMSLLFLGAGRYLYTLVLTRPEARRRALILGADPDVEEAARLLEREAGTEYQVVGIVSTGEVVNDRAVPILGSHVALPNLVVLHAADEVVNASPENDIVANEAVAAVHRADPGVAVRHFSALYEQLTGRVGVRYVCPHWLALVEARTGTYLFLAVKRAMDIVLSTAALVLFSPIFFLIGLAIKVDSRGPVIYRQQREGLHGRTFTMLKFRTMIVGAEAGDAIWERHEDPRRTRVGKFLRPLHLDEVPQLLNVLAGSMSLVGPRPERSQFVAQLEKVAPVYRDRMLVRPGITGWAQVSFGYARSLEESIEKLEYDLFYVKHWSPFLDFVICLKTVNALIRRTGTEASSDSAMLTSRSESAVESEPTTSSSVSVASS